ncbi:MAG TPA: hypothetical protein VJ770_14725, partial [Stellaceae bacterium]|nr:hypothetical protein [Stellaceae bacterium]
LVAPALRAVTPDPALAGMAPTAARLALAAGDEGLARRWRGLLAGAERDRLDFLLALAVPDAALPAGVGREGREFGSPALRIALLSALGRPVPARLWLLLPAAAWNTAAVPRAPVAAQLVLASAAPAKRVGETVLAALALAASGESDPVLLHAAIGGIERVGLDADARRFAVEAALAAGL